MKFFVQNGYLAYHSTTNTVLGIISSAKQQDTMNHTPPMIDGICASRLYLEKLPTPPSTIFAFLCQKFPHIAPQQWQERFYQGLVLGHDFVALHIHSPYHHGQTIYYYREVVDEVVVPFEHHIIFENTDIMVVDKPHFLTVSPAGEYVKQTLLTRLKHETGNPDLSPIHRLDRETAGLILISKNPATRHLYQALFAKRTITKTYHAIAPFDKNLITPLDINLHLERGEPFYTMRVNPDKTPNTHTHLSLLDVKAEFAKYELRPTTGKLHQLRVHLHHLGIPIKNDPYYPQICHKAKADFGQPLQLLAHALAFVDPINGTDYFFQSKQTLVL